MNYLMMICSDGVPTPEKAAAMSDHLDPWLEEVVAGGKLVYGHRLDGPQSARTVQVRDGRTIVSDGPFAESKEFVAGFDMVTFSDPEEAVAAAAKHPVSWFHSLEVRPVVEGHGDADARQAPEALSSGPADGNRRYAIFICVDGVPLSDEEETELGRACDAWGDRVREDGVCPFGVALQPAETATTVRVRAGQTLASDGPFVDTKEFLAGLVVVDLPNIDDAVALAAEHPIARYHRLEVRPFWEE